MLNLYRRLTYVDQVLMSDLQRIEESCYAQGRVEKHFINELIFELRKR